MAWETERQTAETGKLGALALVLWGSIPAELLLIRSKAYSYSA